MQRLVVQFLKEWCKNVGSLFQQTSLATAGWPCRHARRSAAGNRHTARWSRQERRMWSVGNERTDVGHLCIELSATRHGSTSAQHSVDKSRDQRSESTLLVHYASRFLQSKAVNTALSSAIGGGEIVSTGRTSRALQLADSAFR